MNNTTKHQLRGFTLIELLVAIAIIAILAAILFPVFATAREKARQTTCAANLKQIGLAFAQYVQDFDETSPYCPYDYQHVTFSTAPYQYGICLGSQLYPYTKSVQIWRCPSDTVNSPIVNAYLTNKPDSGPGNGCIGCFGGLDNPSYIYNMYFMELSMPGTTDGPPSGTPPTFAPLQYSQMNTPASDGILFGGWVIDGSFSDNNTTWVRLEGYPTATNTTLRIGHNYGCEVLFADTHVKWVPGNVLQTNYNLENSGTCGMNNPIRTFGTCPTLFHE